MIILQGGGRETENKIEQLKYSAIYYVVSQEQHHFNVFAIHNLFMCVA